MKNFDKKANLIADKKPCPSCFVLHTPDKCPTVAVARKNTTVMSKTFTHSITFEEKNGIDHVLVQAGETKNFVRQSDVYFRAEKAESVIGIDYDAFELRAFVGNRSQHREMRPVPELFTSLRRDEDRDPGRLTPHVGVFDTCQPVFHIQLHVHNKSNRALPFAIILTGKAIH